jgi:hypothetical protein
MASLLFARDDCPLTNPEDVIKYLGKGQSHWKKGRSAYELANSWFAVQRSPEFATQKLPESVCSILNTVAAFEGAVLTKGIFEIQTELDDLGRGPSQTDLLALLKAQNGAMIALGVEGKVDEPFGEIVSDWLDFSPTKLRRLAIVIEKLNLKSSLIGELRYQLLHRTVAVLIEAEQRQCSKAVMLVQSFSPNEIRAGFKDFRKFSTAMDMPVDMPGVLSAPRVIHGIELCLGWCESPLCS